jgi:hypothetical protein
MGRREEFTVGKLNITGSGNSPINIQAGTSVPADGSAGYPPGSSFYLVSAALGAVPQWINVGTAASCKFRPFGPQIGYGIIAAGQQASAGGDATETITLGNCPALTDDAFVGHYASDDTDNILAATLTNNLITITGSADPSTVHGYNFGVFREGAVGMYDIVFAGTRTLAGGAAAEAITLTGALATDLGFACYSATNDTDTIAKVVMTANTMTVTMSADPSTAHGLHYMVLRQRGMGKPSHYIAYAGIHTTVGGNATEAITVTGALATDVAYVWYDTTNDTDTILKSVLTANTLTVTMSADPSTAHKLGYLILRAY